MNKFKQIWEPVQRGKPGKIGGGGGSHVTCDLWTDMTENITFLQTT